MGRKLVLSGKSTTTTTSLSRSSSPGGSGSNTNRKISLSHVKKSDPKLIRKAWPGGKVQSNKEEAIRRFLERKKQSGTSNMSKHQVAAMKRMVVKVSESKIRKKNGTSNSSRCSSSSKHTRSLSKMKKVSKKEHKKKNGKFKFTKKNSCTSSSNCWRSTYSSSFDRSRLGGTPAKGKRKGKGKVRFNSNYKTNNKSALCKRSKSLEERLNMALDQM